MTADLKATDACTNQLYFGDNLDILRAHIKDESVDLIYLDPPFNSNASYNVLFKEKSGEKSAAQITAFEDTWQWGIESEHAYHEVVTSGPKRLSDLLQAMRSFLRQSDMMAYLTMMAPRLAELRRVLKPTGSLYLHCDPTSSHYLRMLLDALFGPENFQNEIVWKRTSAHSGSKKWGPVHDDILFYTKTQDFTWNPVLLGYSKDYLDGFYRYSDTKGRFTVGDLTGAGTRAGESGQPWRDVDPTAVGRHWAVPNKVLEELFGHDCADWTVQQKLDALDEKGLISWPIKGKVPRFKRYYNAEAGVSIVDVITDINPLSGQSAERLGYPTQKPEALLERIIRASSNEGDLVLDPFCGCGTTIAAAERLKRRWIGIDITHLAITLMRHRLRDTFGPKLAPFEVLGVPKDLESAKALAEENRYQFEWWALGLVDARPAQDKRKGADRGVDGYINFFDDNTGKAKTVIVQVKSGHIQASYVRDLKGVLEREKAPIGLLITLEEPTRPMIEEAAASGFYEPEHFPGKLFPRIQILTIKDLLAGKEAQYPRFAPAVTFKRAERRRQIREEPAKLL